MTDERELEAFASAAVAAAYGEDQEDDDGGLGPPEDTEAGRAWAALTDEEREAYLEGDEETKEAILQSAFVNAPVEDDEGDDELDDGERELVFDEYFPTSTDALMASINADPAGWSAAVGQDIIAWVHAWADVPPSAWAAECRRTGWPVAVRPVRFDAADGGATDDEWARRREMIARGDKRGYLCGSAPRSRLRSRRWTSSTPPSANAAGPGSKASGRSCASSTCSGMPTSRSRSTRAGEHVRMTSARRRPGRLRGVRRSDIPRPKPFHPFGPAVRDRLIRGARRRRRMVSGPVIVDELLAELRRRREPGEVIAAVALRVWADIDPAERVGAYSDALHESGLAVLAALAEQGVTPAVPDLVAAQLAKDPGGTRGGRGARSRRDGVPRVRRDRRGAARSRELRP